MRSGPGTRLAVAAILALVAVAAGCGDDDNDSSSTSSQTATLTGTRTQLNAGPGLGQSGLKMAPIAPATGSAAKVVLPITGGELDFSNAQGTVELGGGVKYSSAGKSTTLTDIVIDTKSKEVTGKLGGEETTVMDVKLSALQAAGKNLAQTISLTLTSEGARKLGEQLGMGALETGVTMSNGVIQATSG